MLCSLLCYQPVRRTRTKGIGHVVLLRCEASRTNGARYEIIPECKLVRRTRTKGIGHVVLPRCEASRTNGARYEIIPECKLVRRTRTKGIGHVVLPRCEASRTNGARYEIIPECKGKYIFRFLQQNVQKNSANSFILYIFLTKRRKNVLHHNVIPYLNTIFSSSSETHNQSYNADNLYGHNTFFLAE